MLLFVVGGWYSFRQLDIAPDELQPIPLALLVATGPITLLYSGIGLYLMSRSVGTAMPLPRSVTLSTYANLAEALPVPGGAIVRTGALVASGAGLKSSSILVVLSAVLWIAIACLGCGLALVAHGHPAAFPLSGIGFCGSGLATGWLVARAGWKNALLTLGHRIAGMIIISARLHLAFLVMGQALPLADALPFALANVAGSAASIAPSGLGISELLAAGVASTVAVAPAAAFLAVGVDRLIALASSGLYVLVAMAVSGRNGTKP
ncbi:hypothetical protein [Novosphingobium taihuense]|uniref:hypothetical protein n=1 Tax=Novosphingobium taihuense TaxID=260085 RepID=UPI001616E000|nr:hypothetical protein [Novosphingobium taihuense]